MKIEPEIIVNVNRLSESSVFVVKEMEKLARLKWTGELSLDVETCIGKNALRKVKRIFGMPEPCQTYSGQAAWLSYAISAVSGVPYVQVPTSGNSVALRGGGKAPIEMRELVARMVRDAMTVASLHRPDASQWQRRISQMDSDLNRFLDGKLSSVWFSYHHTMSAYTMFDYIGQWMRTNGWPAFDLPEKIVYRFNPVSEDLFPNKK